MSSSYRKLFNLFALSVLALAVYLNFLHTEDDPNYRKINSTKYQQAVIVSRQKAVALTENPKTSLVKQDKKN